VRVAVTGSHDGVRCLAFQAKDGGMAAQVMNSGKAPATVDLEWRGRRLRVELPALSINTYLWSAAE
jgi:O-glycosyl hydrolase